MKKELTFEQAYKKLEKIISQLEKNDTPLDESLKLYEEGCIILNYCKNKLEETKGKIVDVNERIEKAKNENYVLYED